jgi:hypothetical protein
LQKVAFDTVFNLKNCWHGIKRFAWNSESTANG